MIFRLVCVILLAVFSLAAQNNSIQLTAAPPGLVTGLRANVVGAGGQTTYYYWVTARYPIGVSMRAGPARVVNAANTLSAPNSVTISWSPATGATGYDVIRLVTPNFPQTGACTNCVVSSNGAATTFSDVGGAVVNWPTAGTVFAGQAVASLVLNNRDQSEPFLQFSSNPHFFPTRGTGEYSYGFDINGSDDFFTKTGVQKSYLLTVRGDRPAGAAATGDSNDALIRGVYSNYAANDANFIIRGLNTVVNNRSGGTLGHLIGGLVSASSKSGSTSPTVKGLEVNVENFGTNATEHSGIDVTLKNEGAKATLEYGVRVRNIDNSTANAADAAFLVSDAGTNTGFSFGLDLAGATIGTADIKLHSYSTINNPTTDNVTVQGVAGSNLDVDHRVQAGALRVLATQYLDGADGADFASRHARGTIAVPTILQNADDIGAWRATGYDGVDWVGGAEVKGLVDGTPGAGDMPTALVFSTSADGAVAMTERGRFHAAGGLQVAPLANAALGTPANGTMVYCSDCDPTVGVVLACTAVGAQSGAMAFRVNGGWDCLSR